MLSRIGLERFCLVMVAVMTALVGYLWGLSKAPVKHEVVVLEPLTQESPTLGALARPAAPKQAVALLENAEPPAATLPRRHGRPGRTEPAPTPRPDAAEDCVGSDDPLCGLPPR